eukprot:COSAG02_NODE_1489_length_12365_cov_22.798793_2_plen_265_part_00
MPYVRVRREEAGEPGVTHVASRASRAAGVFIVEDIFVLYLLVVLLLVPAPLVRTVPGSCPGRARARPGHGTGRAVLRPGPGPWPCGCAPCGSSLLAWRSRRCSQAVRTASDVFTHRLTCIALCSQTLALLGICESTRGRAVKAIDSKSIGLCPRRFESCRVRATSFFGWWLRPESCRVRATSFLVGGSGPSPAVCEQLPFWLVAPARVPAPDTLRESVWRRVLLIFWAKIELWFLAHAPDRARNFWTEKMVWSDALTREVSDDI